MSVDLTSFFEDNTVPLKRVELLDMVAGRTYITLDGSRIQMKEDNDIILVDISPLWQGETVTSLTKKGMELFFKLIGK